MRRHCVPISRTSGSFVKRSAIHGAKIKRNAPIDVWKTRLYLAARQADCSARSGCPAPVFRPPSVAASLPGGDPLAEALAAGETPSPDLVAESGADGRLAPWLAWSSLAAALGGLAITFQFAVVVFFALMFAIVMGAVIDKLDFTA